MFDPIHKLNLMLCESKSKLLCQVPTIKFLSIFLKEPPKGHKSSLGLSDFYLLKMPSVFPGCFYFTGLWQWQLEYSSSCCYQKQRASRWRRLTRSCAQRGRGGSAGSNCGRQSGHECVHLNSLLSPGRFYHSEECCTFISWRTTSPQYQRVQC